MIDNINIKDLRKIYIYATFFENYLNKVLPHNPQKSQYIPTFLLKLKESAIGQS